MVKGVEKERMVTSGEKGRLPRIPPPRRRKIRVIWERKREETRESVNSSKENLNIVCMSKEPSGNKAMLGHVAPNLNSSVSVSSLSSSIHPT